MSPEHRWKRKCDLEGQDGLAPKKPIGKKWPNQLSAEIVEKILHLRRKYNLGPQWIQWYLERYQYTAIDDATRIRALKVYARHTQENAIHFVDYVIDKFPLAC